MDPWFVDGDIAVSRMTDAVCSVRSAVSYLQADVGDLGPHAPVGRIPEDGEWVRCAELVGDPDWLESVILTTGRALGTDDPAVAASLFVQNYSYRVLTLAIASLTTAGVVPDSSASAMSITLSNGRPAGVGYTRPLALVVGDEGDGLSTTLQARDAVLRAFAFMISRGIDEHVAFLIDATRARIRVGARLLWGNVASSTATAFRTMEGCLGQWVQPLGAQFFENAPTELKGLGSFLALGFADRRGWYWERTNCCLYDRIPGNTRCGDCSRTPIEARRAGYLASLRDT